ncbi:unnamed protein product [Lactuca saligna]|uniref:Uncharacterized protein n=1 Tax=Lactuca saligna TaxID=75948 RepID=A0AA36A610_LACSI|nr:unnamed protein product [Lactuca saligna]
MLLFCPNLTLLLVPLSVNHGVFALTDSTYLTSLLTILFFIVPIREETERGRERERKGREETPLTGPVFFKVKKKWRERASCQHTGGGLTVRATLPQGNLHGYTPLLQNWTTGQRQCLN